MGPDVGPVDDDDVLVVDVSTVLRGANCNIAKKLQSSDRSPSGRVGAAGGVGVVETTGVAGVGVDEAVEVGCTDAGAGLGTRDGVGD